VRVKIYISLLFTLVLTGCDSEKEAVYVPVLQDQSEPEWCSEKLKIPPWAGELVAETNGYKWYRQGNYYYALDANNEMKQSAGLIYEDSNCTNPVAEVFDYPLHYSNDIYVFEFECKLYRYPLGGGVESISNFYYRVPGGECEFITNTVTAREIAPFEGVLGF